MMNDMKHLDAADWTNTHSHGYLYATTDAGETKLLGKIDEKIVEKINEIEKGNERNDILEKRFGIPMMREVQGSSEDSTDRK